MGQREIPARAQGRRRSRVVANMRAMVARSPTREAGRADDLLLIGFTLMRSTIAELQRFCGCAGMWDSIWSPRGISRPIRATWLMRASGSIRPASMTLGRPGLRSPARWALLSICSRFESRLSGEVITVPGAVAVGRILGNGDVTRAACRSGMKMGNLHEQPMEEIWNGPAYPTSGHG